MILNVSDLNVSCKPSPVVFSPTASADSIQANAFPIVGRGTALKCENAASWLQKGYRCPVIDRGEDPAVLESKTLTKKDLDNLKTPEGIVELNREGIAIAVERRVALFFQQSILCYRMSAFTFSAKGADDQIGTSPLITLKATDGSKIDLKREAAHSSTTPSLIAHAKDGSTPNGFVYLKGGTSHDQHNATIGMSQFVNGADELIDGKGSEGTLRAKVVELFNLAANGLSPQKATDQFIEAFYQRVAVVKNGLKEGDERKAVLEAYGKEIQEIQLASREKEFYDQMLGVIVDASTPNEKELREVLYKKRFEVIRLQEVVESRIGKKIADVKATLPKSEQTYLEDALLKEFSEHTDRIVLEKMLGKTAAVFDQTYDTSKMKANQKKAHKSFNTRITKIHCKHIEKIQKLMRDLRAEFRDLRCAEFSFRAGLFKDLRTRFKKWTQGEFIAAYAKTGFTISQSGVSRLEQLSRTSSKSAYKTPITQRRKYIPVEAAEKISAAFGIDTGCFLPSLITS